MSTIAALLDEYELPLVSGDPRHAIPKEGVLIDAEGVRWKSKKGTSYWFKDDGQNSPAISTTMLSKLGPLIREDTT